jgi:hypothetical protein
LQAGQVAKILCDLGHQFRTVAAQIGHGTVSGCAVVIQAINDRELVMTRPGE